MTKEEFTAAFEKCLVNALASSRVAKDSSLEHVILDINRRISINGKSLWNSKRQADNAIKRYVIKGLAWCISSTSVWRRYSGNYAERAPEWADELAAELRQEYAKRLRVIPLRDYMFMEHNRNKTKTEE